MTLQLDLILEDGTYRRLICPLFDRLLVTYVEHLQGLAEHELGPFRAWPDGYEKLGSAATVEKARELRLLRGRFEGSAEATAVRAALLVREASGDRPDCVFFGRDVDRVADRSDLMEAAIRDRNWSFGVVIAAASPEAEAWFISLFVPRSERERAELQRVRRELGFDPTSHAARLLSRTTAHPRDTKRVGRELGLDPDRCAETLAMPFDLMLERGRESGLTAFLVAAARQLPRFGGTIPPWAMP